MRRKSVSGGGNSNDSNEEKAAGDRGKQPSRLRSGSAPPTAEESLIARIFDGTISDEELKSHPAYRSYCEKNENLYPRLLPPPSLDDDRVRLPESLGIGDGPGMYESGDGVMPSGFGGLEEEEVMQRRERDSVRYQRAVSGHHEPESSETPLSFHHVNSSLSGLSLSPGTLKGAQNYQQFYRGSSPSQYLNTASPTFSMSNFGSGGYPASPLVLGHQAGYGNIPHLVGNGAPARALGRSGVGARALGRGIAFAAAAERDDNQQMCFIQNAQYGLVMSNGFHGNSAFGTGYPYFGNQVRYLMFPDTPIDRNEGQMMPYPSTSRNISNLEESIPASPDITGYVAVFSADRDKNHLIQQKLETGSAQEKNTIFTEIIRAAVFLSTDVFGNYVIQKCLELGSASQIRQLAEKLIGNVVTLSLHMRGCRVIQKALEVIELDQKTKIVAELDGHVLDCAFDQNGNHVIRKCITCMPENAIEFLVTTVCDHVVMLSTRSYGCRVIKHVIEHGKPSVRRAIISQLFGKIVEIAKHKYVPNVIEKCLSFATQEERRALVLGMLGSTDENEPLQMMMKDPFGNYVVQKVLAMCDDHEFELLLNRIKVHLEALKQCTYGKHIIPRVERLVVAGEKRIHEMSSSSA